PRHRCRPDVLQPEHPSPERCPNALGDDLVARWPRRVVVGYLDRPRRRAAADPDVVARVPMMRRHGAVPRRLRDSRDDRTDDHPLPAARRWLWTGAVLTALVTVASVVASPVITQYVQAGHPSL